MKQNRQDRDIRDRQQQIDDMTGGASSTTGATTGTDQSGGRMDSADELPDTGSTRERNREESEGSTDTASGISNRPLGREIEEQHRVPDRGTRKSEE